MPDSIINNYLKSPNSPCCSVAKLCPTLCHPMDRSMPGFPVFHCLLEFAQTQVAFWSGLPCPPPGDLPDAGIEPMSLMSSALAGRFFTTGATWEAHGAECKKKKPGWLYRGRMVTEA